jgi:dolichyl-phosphate beta-glucosyltransferase
MGKTFNLFVRTVTSLPVRDSQCGFKLFDRQRCLPLFERGRIQGFSFDVELLVIARLLDLKWREVPVRWYNSRESKVHPVVHSLQMLRDLFRIQGNARRGLYDGDAPGPAVP